MPEPTPEAWAQIRNDYEHSDKPIVEICFEHEITAPMLRYRVKCWDWTRRKPFVPRHGPPPVAVTAQASSPGEAQRKPGGADNRAPDFATLHPGYDRAGSPELALSPQAERGEAAIVPQLQSAVARVLPAIEATIARLASGALSSDGLEKAGRALGALTRTLRELNGLLAQHNARPDDMRCEHCDMPPEDADAFRNELARRIRAFVASRSKEAAQPGSGLPLEALK
jgi:hypothetical protein